MITHEEIMRRIEENIPCSRDMFVAYIKQQKKKDELLELYRELVEKDDEYNTSDNTLQKMRLIEYLKGTRLEIKALEEELK